MPLKFSRKKKYHKLPVHHVDSCIIFPGSIDEIRICRKYMKFVGKKYRAKISIPALGECLKAATELKNHGDYWEAMEFIKKLFDRSGLEVCSIKDSHLHIEKIRELDNRIDEMDCLILACAHEDDAKVFITVDRNLLNSKYLEDEFNIIIKNPKDSPRFP